MSQAWHPIFWQDPNQPPETLVIPGFIPPNTAISRLTWTTPRHTKLSVTSHVEGTISAHAGYKKGLHLVQAF